MGEGEGGGGKITQSPLTSILSHKGRGSGFLIHGQNIRGKFSIQLAIIQSENHKR
jgi:hypothetical protein